MESLVKNLLHVVSVTGQGFITYFEKGGERLNKGLVFFQVNNAAIVFFKHF